METEILAHQDKMTEADFQCYSFVVEDDYRNRGLAEIHLWAFDRQSQTCLLRIQDFWPHCYLQLPKLVDGQPFNWDPCTAEIISSWLRFKLDSDAPIVCEYEEKHESYYYDYNRTTPMLRLSFKTVRAMKRCSKICSRPAEIRDLGKVENISCWEVDISNITKLFSHQGCKLSEGIRLEVEQTNDKTSKANVHEYIADYRTMKPIGETWPLHFDILSIDIETYSDNHKAMPRQMDANHCVTIVSAIHQKFESTERKKFAIVLGDCGEIDDATIVRVPDELGLLMAFADLICKVDPHIVLGYNIYGYDFPYLDTRLKTKMKNWPNMSMLLDKETNLYHKSWGSRSGGKVSINYFDMPGRLCIDLLPLIRRGYKLSKYTLEAVSQEFLHRGKHPVTAKQMFVNFEFMMAALRGQADLDEAKKRTKIDVAYALEDSNLPLDLFHELKIWYNLVAFSNIMRISIIEVITEGQQARCLAQLYDVASRNNFVLVRRDMPRMNAAGGFVGKPVPGVHNNIIVVDFASMYPSIIRAYNLCYTTLLKATEDLTIGEDYQTFVCEQEELLSAKSEADLPDGLENCEDGGKDEVVEVEKTCECVLGQCECEKQKKKTITKRYEHSFVKKNIRVGLVPQLVEKLVNERNVVKRLLATETNAIVILRLTAEELALKTSANSIYGVTGLQGGIISLIEMTMTVTSLGRNMILEVNRYCEEKRGAKIVYNDTDSSMIDFGITDPSLCHQFGEQIAIEISGRPEKKLPDGTVISPAVPGLFPPPLRITFERAVRIMLFKKKKYAYFTILNDGSFKSVMGKPVLSVKGLVPERRDNPPFLRDVYKELLLNVMNGCSIQSSYTIISRAVIDLLAGRIHYKELEIVRQLGANYKSQNYFMNVFASRLSSLGHPVKPGDRLSYVIARVPEEALLGNRMRLIELWEQPRSRLRIKGRPPPEIIDYVYYLEHVLMNPIDQVFEVGYEKQLDELPNAGYQSSCRKFKFAHVRKPVKMFGKIVQDLLAQLEPHYPEEQAYAIVVANLPAIAKSILA